MYTAVLGQWQGLKIWHADYGRAESLINLTFSWSPPDYQQEELFSYV